MNSIHQARLAQSVEHQTLNRRVVGSSPTVDKKFFILYFVASDTLLAGRLAPCKWNQAWRPSELYMCIEREKVDFKSREVNCLKECALALRRSLLEKGPLIDLFLHSPGSTSWGIWLKSLKTCAGPWFLHPYQVWLTSVNLFCRKGYMFSHTYTCISEPPPLPSPK